MKVLNLQCEEGHRFEGWFNGDDEFRDQHTSGFLTCPVCGSGQVVKLPSAPRLNLHTTAEPITQATSASVLSNEHQAFLLRAMREVLARTEDVGSNFPAKVLRMHLGEEAARPIRGQATPEQLTSLLDEGVDVLPLPHLPGLNETLQ